MIKYTIKILFIFLCFAISTQCIALEQYSVTANSLNIRSCGSTKCSVIGGLKKGDKVIVKSISNGWANIIYGNADGYVSLEYLRKEIDSAEIDFVTMPDRNTLYTIIGISLIIAMNLLTPLILYFSYTQRNFKFGNISKNERLGIIGFLCIMIPGILINPFFLVIDAYLILLMFFIAVILFSLIISLKIEFWLDNLFLSDFWGNFMRISGYVGIAVGLIFFGIELFEISFEEWNMMKFYNQFQNNQQLNESKDWISQSVLEERNFLLFKEFFGNTANNLGKVVFSFVGNMFAPWSFITTGMSFVRLS